MISVRVGKADQPRWTRHQLTAQCSVPVERDALCSVARPPGAFASRLCASSRRVGDASSGASSRAACGAHRLRPALSQTSSRSPPRPTSGLLSPTGCLSINALNRKVVH